MKSSRPWFASLVLLGPSLVLALCGEEVLAQSRTLPGNFGRLKGLLEKWEQVVVTNPDGKVVSGKFAASKFALFPTPVRDEKRTLQPCSFTVVGPEVVLTAGHCVAGYFVVPETDLAISTFVVCTKTAQAGDPGRPDLALCRAASKNLKGAFVPVANAFPQADYPGGYESIDADPLHLTPMRRVLLTGHGCIGQQQPVPGTFAGGYASVLEPDDAQGNRVRTQGGASLCPGDSGGAVYAVTGTDFERRVVIGVGASKLPSPDQSLVSSLSSAESRTFVANWVAANSGVRICGVNYAKHCRGL